MGFNGLAQLGVKVDVELLTVLIKLLAPSFEKVVALLVSPRIVTHWELPLKCVGPGNEEVKKAFLGGFSLPVKPFLDSPLVTFSQYVLGFKKPCFNPFVSDVSVVSMVSVVSAWVKVVLKVLEPLLAVLAFGQKQSWLFLAYSE